jgi:hypothetical protein
MENTPKGLHKIAGGKTEGRHPRLELFLCFQPCKGWINLRNYQLYNPFRVVFFEGDRVPGVAVLRPYPRLPYFTPLGYFSFVTEWRIEKAISITLY